MAEFFDENRWREVIKKPDWYVRLYPELQELRRRWEAETDPGKAAAIKKHVRGFFEAALQEGTIALAADGPDLDAQRKPVDTVIVHHTSSEPGYRLSYMNAVHMLNIYVPYFMNPTDETERQLRHAPLWSNHVRAGGRPVFYAYHWLMRMDGTFERLLEDDELGWHAANWDVNCRSIAICLDNDYEKKDPDEKILRALADFIREQYPDVDASRRIFGHSEVSGQLTICPGGNFVDGWKQDLHRYVNQSQ